MQKVVFPNGLTVIYAPKPGRSVVVEVMAKVGSNHENSSERGITHFIEHMLFEGTKKWPTNKLLSNQIERIGGDFNAYTTSERTCFYIKALRKHFPLAVEVLADMIQQPLFEEAHVKKERHIVIKEIDLMNDEPKYYQWILLLRHLFQKHPAKFPTYGDKKILRRITRTQVLHYFQKHYLPNNIIIAVVGDVPNWKEFMGKHFSFSKKPLPKKSAIAEPQMTKGATVKAKRDIANTYLVLGFKTVPHLHPDAYALEVINGILGRGQSGRMFTELRGKQGLAYDVGTQHIAEVSYGFFAAYATIDQKNSLLVKERILQELAKLQRVPLEDVQEAQEYIEGSYFVGLDDAQKVADQLLFWEQIGNVSLMGDYIAKIKRVTLGDVRRVAEKYFKNPTIVAVEKE